MSFDVGTKVYSVVSFLSNNAVRSTNSLDGIDHCTSNNSTVCAVQSITVPELYLAMGAANFIRDTEMTFDLAKSTDKDFAVIEGALHPFTPCRALRKDAGSVFEHGEKPVRLRLDMDQRAVLARRRLTHSARRSPPRPAPPCGPLQFRLLYYIAPFTIALSLMGIREIFTSAGRRAKFSSCHCDDHPRATKQPPADGSGTKQGDCIARNYRFKAPKQFV